MKDIEQFEGTSVGDIVETALMDKKFMGTYDGLNGKPYVNHVGEPLPFDPVGMYVWKVYTNSDNRITLFLNKYNRADMVKHGERSMIVDVTFSIFDDFKVE